MSIPDVLLNIEKACIEITRWHRCATSIDNLNERFVLIIKAIEDIGREFRVSERMADGGKSIR
jgi:hypothetical protein